MTMKREINVYLLPELADPETLPDGVAVVIDVLRASTTIVAALSAGCSVIVPVAELEEARSIAHELPAGKIFLGGERDGQPIEGFDFGNSPLEYTPKKCKDIGLVFTTTNGTRAILQAASAHQTLVAAFTNFSAVCDQLLNQQRPVHIICAGTDGDVTLEDTVLAGAFVDRLANKKSILNDGARIAWDSFEHHGEVWLEALKHSRGGRNLTALKMAQDIEFAAEVDRVFIVPELKRDPLRIEIGSCGAVRSHWPKSGG